MKPSSGHKLKRQTFFIVSWVTIFTQIVLSLSFAYTPLVQAARDSSSKWYQSANNNQNGQPLLENPYDSMRSISSEGAASGMARSAATASVNNSVEELLSQFGTARVQLNLDKKFKVDVSEADILIPLYEEKSNILFTQLGLRHKDERNTGNLGVGTRYFTSDWMFGVNTFFDNEFSGKNRRLGLGVEAWRDYFKLTANSYVRLSNWRHSPGVEYYDERPANGYDVRAEGWLPAFPQLGAKVMYENYQGDEVALFGKDNRQKDPWAFTSSINYTPVPLITLSAQHRTGKDGHNDSQLLLQLNYRLSESWDKQVDQNMVGTSRTLNGSRYDLIERNNNIVLAFRKQETVTLVLPEKSTGKGHSTLPISFTVKTKNPLLRIDWDASSLITAGGSITQVGNNQLSVVLPSYQVAGSNIYHFTGIAYDVKGNSGSATAEIHVEVGEVSPKISKVSATPTSILADGKSKSKINISLFDPESNPVAGMKKSLKVSVTETVSQTRVAGTTENLATLGEISEISPGMYQAILTAGNRIGELVITPYYNDNELPSVKIQQNADSATGHIDTGAILATVDNSVADNSSENIVSATITDAGGNPLANTLVTFSMSGSATPAQSSSLTARTDNNGKVTLSLIDSIAEVVTVTATLENSNMGKIDIHFLANNSTATLTKDDLTVDKTAVIANNLDVVTYSAVVKDAKGNVVPNFTVNWTTNKGNLSGASTTTDANGLATVTLKGNIAGAVQVSAQVGNSVKVNAPVVELIADSSSATLGRNNLTVDKTTLIANNTDMATYTAIVKDSNGNPLPSLSIEWKTDLGTLSGATSTTDTEGKTTITLKSMQAGDAQVTASVNNVITNADKITFTADSTTATISKDDLSADKTTVVANNTDLATFTTVVKDANGNPVPNFIVIWSSDIGILSGNISTTSANGKATITLKSTIAGTAQVVVQAGTSGNVNAPSINFVPDSTTANIDAGDLNVDKSTVLANDIDIATYTALVKDANGNRIPSSIVIWSTDKGTLSDTSTATGASGVATVTLKDTLIGLAHVTARVGVSGSVSAPVVTFKADSANLSPARSALTAAPATIVADGSSASVVTLVLKDANGNPVSGQSVAFASSLANSSAGAVTDRGDGSYTADLTGTGAGVASITASVGGSAFGASAASVTLTADSTNLSPARSALTAAPATIVADGSSASVVTLVLKDANGNPVSGQSIVFKISSSILGSMGNTTDVGEGIYTAKITAGTTSGTASVTVTVNGDEFNLTPATVAMTKTLKTSPNQLGSVNIPAGYDLVEFRLRDGDWSRVPIVLPSAGVQNGNKVTIITEASFASYLNTSNTNISSPNPMTLVSGSYSFIYNSSSGKWEKV